MEEHDITMEELWKHLSDKEKKALEDFGMAPEPVQPAVEKISRNIKEDDGDSTQQPDRHHQEKTGD